jgi:cell wall-associated NlpC family hydrolase
MSIQSRLRIVAVSASLVIASPALAQDRCGAGESCDRAQAGASSATPSVVAIRSAIEGEDVVRTARKYLGVRYVLGGETPAAFDCSGFVRWVFAQHGIALPRTAHEQAGFGDAPGAGEPLQPGDLLFFYGGNGAQHIAMYVGRDTIIHASSRSRRVKLDRFGGKYNPNSSWFGERLIAVRRILPMEGVFYLPTSAASPSNGGRSIAAVTPTGGGTTAPEQRR